MILTKDQVLRILQDLRKRLGTVLASQDREVRMTRQLFDLEDTFIHLFELTETQKETLDNLKDELDTLREMTVEEYPYPDGGE